MRTAWGLAAMDPCLAAEPLGRPRLQSQQHFLEASRLPQSAPLPPAPSAQCPACTQGARAHPASQWPGLEGAEEAQGP